MSHSETAAYLTSFSLESFTSYLTFDHFRLTQLWIFVQMNGSWQGSAIVCLWGNSYQKEGHVGRPSEVLEFGTDTGFSVTCAQTLAIASENSALTPDSDPKLQLAPRFWPKIATRNLGVRPQILYRTNFHKCRCSHVLKRSRVIFQPHKWSNCAKSSPLCAQNLECKSKTTIITVFLRKSGKTQIPA